MDQANNLNLLEKSLEVTIDQGPIKTTIPVHYLVSHTLDNGLNEKKKTIVVLPGLDDSVFLYKNALNQIQEFNPDWGLVGIDLRGQGRTRDEEGVVRTTTVKLDDQVLLLEQVLENLNIEKAFIVGLSYGGGVALHYAGHFSKRVHGLGLIAPFVTDFKSYKPGIVGLYYHLASLNPMTSKLAPFSLPSYFRLAQRKGNLNPNVNWTANRLKALTQLTLGILKFDTDKALEETPLLPMGIHILTACQDAVIPIAAHRHFYNRIPKNMDKSFSLEDGIGHRVLSNHPKRAALWLHRILQDEYLTKRI